MDELTLTLITGFALLSVVAVGTGQFVKALFAKKWDTVALIVAISAVCAFIAPQITIGEVTLTNLQGAAAGLLAAGLVKIREGKTETSAPAPENG